MSDHGRRKRAGSYDESSAPVDQAKRVRSGVHQKDGKPRLRHEDYTVGWICALSLEMAAAECMLDVFHESLDGKDGDDNAYTLGSIASSNGALHNIVMACLPKGSIGTSSAAVVAAHMARSFPSIDKRLMVGIGGGAPDLVDVRLGDVVVGVQVVQYDLGKATPHHFQHTAIPTRPPPAMLTAVSKLHASHSRYSSSIPQIIDGMLSRNPTMSKFNFNHLRTADLLFEHSYKHASTIPTCQNCDKSKLIEQSDRASLNPIIHYGTIASGNAVIKDGVTRNRLAQELKAICFDMEAAGLGANFPCLVIRGICDYSDSHKNKVWQEYAAAAAAAHAKELLLDMPAVSSSVDLVSLQNSSGDNGSEVQERRELLLDSLAFDDIESRQSSIKSALRKTCEWFLQDPLYLDWLDPDKFSDHLGILWISGKPGTGKSTMMKFAHAYTAKKWESESGTGIVSFFFNARGVHLEKSTEGMYRSLLYQVFQLFPNLRHLLDRHGRKHKTQEKEGRLTFWTLGMLENLFENVIRNLGQRRLICFIDALDECSEDEIREMVSSFEELGETASQNRTSFSVCFSSRHYPHIRLQRGGLRLTLEDQPGHSQDINYYVNSKLAIEKSKLSKQFRDLILQKAAGVFMWVVLVVDILNKELQHGRIAEAKRVLVELPLRLSDLFKDILARERTNLESHRLCIQWILYAQRPLTCPELYFAIYSGLTNDATFPQEWDDEYETPELMRLFILSASKGLAEVTGVKRTVQFIHESVRDFLIKDNGISQLWPEHSTGFDTFSHDRLKTCCLAYAKLSGSSSWHFGHRIKELNALAHFKKQQKHIRTLLSLKYPFLEYAVTNVLYHAEASLTQGTGAAFPEGMNFSRWICLDRLYQNFDFRCYDVNTPKPWIFAERNHVGLLKDYYSKTSNHLEIQAQLVQDHPIFAAIRRGHEAAYRFFRSDQMIDINLRNRQDETMLTVAVNYDHEHIVKDLLSHPDIDVNAQSGHNQTALLQAAWRGRSSITKRLLRVEGIDINLANRSGRTACLAAASTGHLHIVDQLLAHSPFTYINLRDKFRKGRTILSYAAEGGSQDRVRQLVAAGADVNLCDMNGNSPLMYAVPWGLDVLRELLNAPDLDVNQKNREGWSALSYAAARGAQGVLHLLLNREGLDINSQQIFGTTPLSCAVGENKLGAVRQLISAGADVNIDDIWGYSPLMKAVNHPQDRLSTEMVKELLKAPGLDINARNREGRTALGLAELNKHWEAVDLLCRVKGIIINHGSS